MNTVPGRPTLTHSSRTSCRCRLPVCRNTPASCRKLTSNLSLLLISRPLLTGSLCRGSAEACKYMQNELNLKLGSTTGFTRAMVDVLLDTAVKEGYNPDYVTTATYI